METALDRHALFSVSLTLKRLVKPAALAWLGLFLLGICVADDPQKNPAQDPPKTIWTRKMEHAQRLLVAVAQDEPAMVERQTRELIKISNELAWKKFRTEKYEELSKAYRQEAESLIKAAQQKNKDGMALGYVKLTLACFNCHNQVREIKIAQ